MDYSHTDIVAALIGNKQGAEQLAGVMLHKAVMALTQHGRREKLQAVVDLFAPITGKQTATTKAGKPVMMTQRERAVCFAFDAMQPGLQAARAVLGKCDAGKAESLASVVACTFVSAFADYAAARAAEKAESKAATPEQAESVPDAAIIGAAIAQAVAFLATIPADALALAFTSNDGQNILGTLRAVQAAADADKAVRDAMHMPAFEAALM